MNFNEALSRKEYLINQYEGDSFEIEGISYTLFIVPGTQKNFERYLRQVKDSWTQLEDDDSLSFAIDLQFTVLGLAVIKDEVKYCPPPVY